MAIYAVETSSLVAPSCGGVRFPGGRPFRGGDVLIHRHRGLDPVGGRRTPDGRQLRRPLMTNSLRSAIHSHGLWLFKHTGYGVCAAFASARSAVHAAVVTQRELQLPVRMGLATGEAELRGGDYFGGGTQSRRPGDGRRARQSDPAGRFDGKPASGIDLLDLGRRRLRDLPTAVGVFQVRGTRAARRVSAAARHRRWCRQSTARRRPVSSGAKPRSPRCRRCCGRIGW